MFAAILSLLATQAVSAVFHVLDAEFPQDVSHRSTFDGVEPVADWPVLPFTGSDKGEVIFLESTKCFYALHDGVLYSSSVNTERNQIDLDSPFNSWTSMYTMDGSPVKLANSNHPDAAFFMITDDNLAAITLDNTAICGGVSAATFLMAEPRLWGTIGSWTSSESIFWLSSSNLGLSQIALGDLDTKAAVVTSVAVGAASGAAVDDATAIGSMLWVDKWEKLVVGTPMAMYTYKYSGDTIASVTHEWVGAIVDTVPLDMAYETANDALWIVESDSVHKQTADGRLWRIGQKQGSHTANLTSISICNGYVWVGSSFGVSRVSVNVSPIQQAQVAGSTKSSAHPSKRTDNGGHDSHGWRGEDPWTWAYYHGNRYLSDNSVSFIVSTGDVFSNTGTGVALVGSATGFSLLELSAWTLADKAKAMGTFQLPRHSRYGLVSEAQLYSYGRTDKFFNDCNDNDGLWTSMHVMGESYRFMVTGEEEARQWAWDGFEALEKLSLIPGAYPSFPARSFAKNTDMTGGCLGDVWKNSTAPGWEEYIWKSTTSSDEIDGHLAAYPLVYDHIARTDEEKARVYALIEGITGGLLANDLYLIDPSTNEPTQWGFWNPKAVNDDPEHYSERGANSVGILSYCASAYSITHDEKYLTTFWDLANNHGYINNAMNSKIDCPWEDNHSDNELLMQAYHILFYSLQRLDKEDESLKDVRANVEAMVTPLIAGLERMWSIVQTERSPLWVGVYAGTAGMPVCPITISDAVWSLRRYSIDLIDWPIDNSNRWDITPSPFVPRDSGDNATPEWRQMLPNSERAVRKQNSNPFDGNAMGNGLSEEAPYVWRLPYYLMLYNGLITTAK